MYVNNFDTLGIPCVSHVADLSVQLTAAREFETRQRKSCSFSAANIKVMGIEPEL